MKNILITGGSGLVGKQLTRILEKNKSEVSWIGRSKKERPDHQKYNWDVENGNIDKGWLQCTDTIIHLAGAGVADHKWSDSYKKEIYESRIKSTKLLHDTLSNNDHSVKTLVCASAIGIYGNNCLESTDETFPAQTNFLAKVCNDWEKEAHKFELLGIRVVIIRVGIVLAKEGGFIKAVAAPTKWGLGAAFGNGKMMTSWIHINDLCGIFMKAGNDRNMKGAYNAVAPNPVSNKQITKVICQAMHRPYFLPNVPAIILKLALGEMASMILANQNISSKKIEKAGYAFAFNHIEEAVRDVIK
jgi:uncharacterized protein (TIGR01777 family)